MKNNNTTPTFNINSDNEWLFNLRREMERIEKSTIFFAPLIRILKPNKYNVNNMGVLIADFTRILTDIEDKIVLL